jgi:hypothetical protein
MLSNLATVLHSGATSDDPANVAIVRRIVEAMTGGKIIISQQGGTKKSTRWLRGTFRLRLLEPLADELGLAATHADGPEVHVDFRLPAFEEELAPDAKALFDQGLLVVEIAAELSKKHGRKINRNLVKRALTYWFTSHGMANPDGRTRRKELDRKALAPNLAQRIADEVLELSQQGMLYEEIATRLDVDRNVVTAAINVQRKRGIDIPDGRSRRKLLERKYRSTPDGLYHRQRETTSPIESKQEGGAG